METPKAPEPPPMAPWPPPDAAVEPPHEPAHRELERQFGGRAFVWIGGVALALAGFFLVKYSIETGILTEKVRCILGVLFGLGLLGGSHVVRKNEPIADGTRISQALAGAGIADLYGSLFAATTLYHLLPGWLGFGAMAAVTAAALVLSLLHGAPIAVLGLIGGYATPALIEGNPNAPLLFGYLYIVCAGLTVLARSRRWWWMPAPAVGVTFLWVIAWLLMGRGAADAMWLSVFLVAVAATAFATRTKDHSAETEVPQAVFQNIAPLGAIVLMAAVGFSAHFGAFEWAMYGLLSACALALAAFDEDVYRLVPWLAMGANLLMLLAWDAPDSVRFAIALSCFAALFAAVPQIPIRRAARPAWWAGLSAAAAVFYFLLAYAKLDMDLAQSIGKSSADMVWALLATAAAASFALSLTQLYVLNAEPQVRRTLQAIHAVAATTLLSLGLAIVLSRQYLPLAAAAEVFALSWIALRLEIGALRIIAVVLTALFLMLAIPAFLQLMGAERAVTAAAPSPLVVLAVPCVLFAAASHNWRKQKDDRFVQALECGSVLLGAAFCYRLAEIALRGHARIFDLLDDSLFTVLLFALSLAAFRAARRFEREAIFWAAAAMAAIASVRVVVFQLLFDNPVAVHQWVGALPVFNVVLAAYAAPAAAAVFVARELDKGSALVQLARVSAYVLGAITLTLWVRQLFQGAYLDYRSAGNAEVYAYSVAWLVTGAGLLLAAVRRNDPMMRVASVIVTVATVGKVFLYDAAALTGLWRVVSFLCLGLSLLGLSWFYSRFVFVPEKTAQGKR